MSALAAGAAAVSLEPPLGLPMVGFVRRHEPARSSLGDLEATALALEAEDGARAVVIGIDTVAIQAPEVDALRARVAAALRCPAEAVLLNFSHTHCAPPASPWMARLGGTSDETAAAVAAYAETLADRVVAVARLALSRCEEARPVWGVGWCPEAVNRRERLPDGRVILGWHPEGLVDWQVPVLQLQRLDASAVATVVGYGCHTVSVGPDVLAYSADYPGPLRAAVRGWTGGECVFLQGAGGNVLPRVAFADDLGPSHALGRRLALAALGAVADRPAWATAWQRSDDGSVTPFHLYRPRAADGPAPALRATERAVAFPLLPLPGAAEVADELRAAEARVAAAATPAERHVARYDRDWAARTAAALADGSAPATAHGPVGALRIGDGAIATGPGEVFSEIGLAVRERSPADVTLYAGYTNGMVSYFPAASEYPHGGYEPGYGNRTFGLPAPVAPACDGLLVRHGLEALATCFPDRPAPPLDSPLLASGRPPAVPGPLVPSRP